MTETSPTHKLAVPVPAEEGSVGFGSFFRRMGKSARGSKLLQEGAAARQVAIAGIASLPDAPLSDKQAFQLTKRVNDLVESPAFIGELSSAIGSPKSDETEDAFVLRCKKAMRSLLENRLRSE